MDEAKYSGSIFPGRLGGRTSLSGRVAREVTVVASPVIEVRGLRMSYGSVDAVSGIDLEVDAGEVFAFLGPNGSRHLVRIRYSSLKCPLTRENVSDATPLVDLIPV